MKQKVHSNNLKALQLFFILVHLEREKTETGDVDGDDGVHIMNECPAVCTCSVIPNQSFLAIASLLAGIALSLKEKCPSI